MEGFNNSIFVEELITQESLKCYKITSDMEIGTAEMFCNTIKHNGTILKEFEANRPFGHKMTISSDDNIYGALISDTYVEGDYVDVYMPNGLLMPKITLVSLSQKNNEYLPETSNCTSKSFYHCMADKALDVIDQGNCTTKCIPPFFKSILDLATKKSGFDLCQEYQPNKCIGGLITQRLVKAARLEECQRSCKQTDFYAKVSGTNAIPKFWPEGMDNEVCFGFATTIVKVDEEYLIYGFADMVGSVGGSLGLFLGFSFLDQLSSLLAMIQRRLN